MTAYYNEYDKNAAAWLRELINMGLIAEGDVDERSIIEVEPIENNRCHWFAGIGGWDYALQLAGWPSNRPVWTASLPCQPFSLAGKGLGKNDERHLLPHFLELVDACMPPVIFGEQVPAAIGHGWLDDLCHEMEGKGYAVRASVLSAAGVGAPHIRQRLYWVANTANGGRQPIQNLQSAGVLREALQQAEQREQSCDLRAAFSGLANSSGEGLQEQYSIRRISPGKDEYDEGENVAGNCWMGDSESIKNKWKIQQWINSTRTSWTDCDWLYCRDNKYRPIKPGIKPLVNGIPRGMVYSSNSSVAPNETGEARAMRLKGYGNAIVPQVAAEFIKAFMEVEIGMVC